MSKTTRVLWFFAWWLLSFVLMLAIETWAYGDIKSLHLWVFVVALAITLCIEVPVMNRLDPPKEEKDGS